MELKENRMIIHRKMDAISLQGVWLDFPGVSTHGHLKYAAGLYLQLIQEERRKKKKHPSETAKEMRTRLLKEVEKRIIEQDENELVLLLAI